MVRNEGTKYFQLTETNAGRRPDSNKVLTDPNEPNEILTDVTMKYDRDTLEVTSYAK